MKKMAVILVVCCVLLFSSLDVQAQWINSSYPASCCFKIYRNPQLPKNRVVSVKRTHTYCAKNAVVFTVRKGRKFCVDPTQAWVQDVIAHVQARTKKIQ